MSTLRREARDGRPLAAVMRHAARHPIADPRQPAVAELTPDGCAAAESFGRQLTGFARLRLFHSPVNRCRQTAECIARGAESNGVAIEWRGPQPELGLEYIRDLGEAGRLTIDHGEHFVRLWFGGQVPTNVIDDARRIADQKTAFVRRNLQELASVPGALDLHVSHDWNIIVLRELCAGVRHEDVGWLSFLDGVVFTTTDERLRVVYREHSREVAL